METSGPPRPGLPRAAIHHHSRRLPSRKSANGGGERRPSCSTDAEHDPPRIAITSDDNRSLGNRTVTVLLPVCASRSWGTRDAPEGLARRRRAPHGASLRSRASSGMSWSRHSPCFSSRRERRYLLPPAASRGWRRARVSSSPRDSSFRPRDGRRVRRRASRDVNCNSVTGLSFVIYRGCGVCARPGTETT